MFFTSYCYNLRNKMTITAWNGASTENTRIANKILIIKPVIKRKLILILSN